MTAAELAKLLAPVSAEAPCGADLEQTSATELYELDRLATREPPREQGRPGEPGYKEVAGKEPDWSAVRAKAEELFAKGKHLRVAVVLGRALTNNQGIEGMWASLRLLHALLEQYWDSVYPRLEDATPDGAQLRINEILPVVHVDTLNFDLRARKFFDAPGAGAVLVRDVESAAGRFPARQGVSVTSSDQIKQALHSLPPERAQALRAAVTGCGEEIKALRSLLSEKAGAANVPDFKTLSDIVQALAAVVDAGAAQTEPATSEQQVGAGEVRAASGTIASREDAVRMLESVCAFLERYEPSNPAPLLIRRAKDLIGRPFLEIVEELAPDGVNQVKHIAGLK